MDATTELTRLSGLQQLQAIFAGKTGYAGIVKTLDLHPVSAEEGFVVFEGSPTQAVYNPLGSVHGGYAATAEVVLARFDARTDNRAAPLLFDLTPDNE
jgi:hypothetical protein